MVQAIGDSGGSIGINFCKDFLSVDQEEHPANRFCAMRMVEAVIDQIGIDHVHIGSDFDGCTVPDDIKDMSTIPQWLEEIAEKLSLTSADIDKIAHGNMLRVIRQVWS
jgi:membrane dipeptidase